MKYILIIVATLTAVAAIRGKTWDENASGLRKLTIVGWVTAILAFAAGALSLFVEYSEQSEKQAIEQKEEFKRLDAKALLARIAFEIEVMVSELENSEVTQETLARLNLQIDRLVNSLNLQGSNLNRSEFVKAIEFMLFAKTELAELEYGKVFANNLPANELARSARELRMMFCWELMGGDDFCQFAQGNPTADPIKISTDQRMREAIEEARKSLPELIKDIPHLEELGLELQIKAAVQVGKSKEYIWLNNATYTGNEFRGFIGNFPSRALFLELGQPYLVSLENVCDWMVVYEGVLYGGYMLRVTRDRMTELERNEFDRAMRFTTPPEPLHLPW